MHLPQVWNPSPRQAFVDRQGHTPQILPHLQALFQFPQRYRTLYRRYRGRGGVSFFDVIAAEPPARRAARVRLAAAPGWEGLDGSPTG